MNKFKKYQVLILVATFSLTFTACSDNDEPSDKSNTVSNLTLEQIKNTFKGQRLDSIHSHMDYANIKMEYQNGMLVSYKECYEDGSVHDRVNFNLRYTQDTIYVNSYKAVVGDNGLVKKLICSNGKVNNYVYDEQNHLIRYEDNVKDLDDKGYYEINWDDDNITSFRINFQKEDGSESYEDVFYTYTSDLNIGAILPPLRSYNWICDSGKSVNYGINDVLYYAGLLGRGTKNLLKTSRNKWQGGSHNQSYTFMYVLDEAGYVESVSDSGHVDEYFFSQK